MYRKLSQHTDRVAGFRIEGEVTREEYRQITRQIEDALEEFGTPICLLIEVRDLESVDPGTFWDDLRFAVRHWHDIEALALVGETEKVGRLARVGGTISPTEVRQFEPDAVHEAWEWIRGRDREMVETRRRKMMEREPSVPRHVLVAVDFTSASRFVVRTASQYANKFGATLALIHVVDFQPPVALGLGWNEVVGGDMPGNGLEKPALAELKKLAGELGVSNSELLARHGDPRSRILEAAEEYGTDLIVVGSRSRRGIGRLLGSTANGVVHSARCAVLTVPVPRPE